MLRETMSPGLVQDAGGPRQAGTPLFLMERIMEANIDLQSQETDATSAGKTNLEVTANYLPSTEQYRHIFERTQLRIPVIVNGEIGAS